MLGERIDRRRRELGLSQSDLARRSGLSRQYISALILGGRGQRLTVFAATKLAKALRVNQKFLQAESTSYDNVSTHASDGRG